MEIINKILEDGEYVKEITNKNTIYLHHTDFYTYLLLDPRVKGYYTYGEYSFEYEPFYVGKGKGDRCKRHLTEKRTNKCNIEKILKIKEIKKKDLIPIIIKIKENITNNEALDLEIDMISKIGRQINGGPLVNLTNGGENPPVHFGDDNPMTREENKAKFRGAKNTNFNKKGFDNHKSIPVSIYDLNDVFIETIGSMRQAQVKYGYDFSSIVRNCKGLLKRVGQHKFKYYNNDK